MSQNGDVCGESLTTKDGFCDRTPSRPDGKCGFHTDLQGFDQDWEPSYKHGLYMDRSGYYEKLPESEQEWIDAVVDSFLQDAPFDAEDLGKLEKLRQVGIDLHQRRTADEKIHGEMTQTQEVGFHEQYGVLEETKENVLFITKDRLSRESRMTLKDLGIIDNNSSQNDVDTETVLEKLANDSD